MANCASDFFIYFRILDGLKIIRMQIRICQAYLVDLVAVFNAIFVQSNMLENIMLFGLIEQKLHRNLVLGADNSASSGLTT